MIKEALRLTWFAIQVALFVVVMSYLMLAAIMEPLK
jgi:hypothetical protein